MAADNIQRMLEYVFEYERRSHRDAQDRRVMKGTDGIFYPINGNNLDDLVRYGAKCREYLSFLSEIVKAQLRRLPSETAVLVRRDTPEILRDAGLENLSITHTQKHVRDELKPISPTNEHYHGLEPSDLLIIPELLDTPWAAITTIREGEARVAVFVESFDPRGNLMNVVLRPNGLARYHGVTAQANACLTIFGRPWKESIDMIEEARKTGKLLYFNAEKAERFLSREGYRITDSLKNLNGIIQQLQQANQEKSQINAENVCRDGSLKGAKAAQSTRPKADASSGSIKR